jgi:phosphotransferase system enzyme I (PtsP)
MGTAAQTGLTRDAILIARNLGPAELLEYDRRRLKGVLLEEGSLTSHMTIVARAIGVPVLGRLHDIRHSVDEGETILVDGDNGSVIIRRQPCRAATASSGFIPRCWRRRGTGRSSFAPSISAATRRCRT